MDGNDRSLSIDELLSGIWRRRRLALGIAAGVMVCGVLWLAIQPKTYRATAVVRMKTQELPVQLMPTTVNERIPDRLNTVKNELLSQPVLATVVEELDLYPDVVSDAGIGAAVETLRENLQVKVEGENAFGVTFEGRDPEVAARVANRLTEVYARLAIEERAAAADRAAQVFGQELERMRPQVEDVEKKIAAFKAKNATELPEALESNLDQLGRLTTLANSALVSLADAQRRRTALAHQGNEGTLDLERYSAAVNDARRELAAAEAEYTANAPEVQTARRHFEELQNRYGRAAESAAAGDSAMRRVSDEIAWLQQTAADYRLQMDAIVKRVEGTPGIGAQLAGLTREYEALSHKWNDVVSRKIEAEMARDLESRQKESLFRTVEPAYPPSGAASPDPVSVLGIALLLALALGLGVPGAMASRDTSLSGVAEARRKLGLPVLATVPELPRGGRRAG